MKNTKIIALALSSCLFLGSFAGCNKNEPSNSSESSSEAVTSSETTTTTSATSEDTKATGSEESKDTGSSEAADDDSEKIILEGDSQTYANTYISNLFTGVNVGDKFDVKDAKIEVVLSFAILHLENDSPEDIKVGEKGECSYGTISFDKARDEIGKYMMYVLSEDDCKVLPAPPDSYNASHANSWGPYYEDGKIWYQLGGGEIYNSMCVVDYAKSEEDGSMTLVFTIYGIDLDLYNSLTLDQLNEYYKITPAKAKSDKNLTKRGTGTANVSVGQSGNYLLNTYERELIPVD